MDRVQNLVTIGLQIQHGIRQEIPSTTLNSGLKDTTSDECITSPLPSVSILTMDDNAHFLTTPRSGDQLEIWPLPADEAA